MEKSNKNKTMPPDGRPNINLENSSSLGASFRNSGKDEQLSNKNLFSGDAIRSITSPNEKDNAYINNLDNQQQ